MLLVVGVVDEVLAAMAGLVEVVKLSVGNWVCCRLVDDNDK